MLITKNEYKMKYTNGLKTVIVGSFMASAIILFIIISGCATEHKIILNNMVVVEQPFDEWINQEFHPEPPQVIGFKDPPEWSSWNTFWFASTIGGRAADIASTQYALNNGGCKEANPIYGDNPSTGKMILISAAVVGATWLAVEYWIDEEDREIARNWIYGLQAAISVSVAAHNMSLNCN